MPEREIEELPQGGNPRSFQILVEWLRENRKSLERRFDTIENAVNRRMDDQDEKLQEIHTETRRTNGRVNDLEKAHELDSALVDGRHAWEDEQQAEIRERRERHEKRMDRLTNFAFAALGLLAGSVGHLLGLL